MNWLVFTDLDGTLLDHTTYRFDAALESLSSLKEMNVPVIIVTSKTRAEVDELRSTLALEYPFVIENGAAIYMPSSFQERFATFPWQEISSQLDSIDGYLIKALSPSIDYWLSISSQLQQEFSDCCQPFSAMDVAQVSELTGLSQAAATLAKQREYSDPIYWFGSDSRYKTFERAMQTRDLRVVRGGRFVHLLKGADKGLAVTWIKDFFQRHSDSPYKTLALGDGGNDVAMLEVVDIPVLVRSEHHEYPSVNSDSLYRTNGLGPVGWAEAIRKYITQKS